MTNWQDDTELSDLGRKVGDAFGFSWQYVAIRLEEALADRRESLVLHGTSISGSKDIRVELVKTYDEYAAALEMNPDKMDDRDRRIAILEALLREWVK